MGGIQGPAPPQHCELLCQSHYTCIVPQACKGIGLDGGNGEGPATTHTQERSRPSPCLQHPGSNPVGQLCSAAEPSLTRELTWVQVRSSNEGCFASPGARSAHLPLQGMEAEQCSSQEAGRQSGWPPEHSLCQAWRLRLLCQDRDSSSTVPLLLSGALSSCKPEKPLQKTWEVPEADPTHTHTQHPGRGADHKPASRWVWLPPRLARVTARNT